MLRESGLGKHPPFSVIDPGCDSRVAGSQLLPMTSIGGVCCIWVKGNGGVD